MKKIYMSPVMDIIELKKQTLLAGSNLDVMSGVDLGDAIDATCQEADAPVFGDLDVTFME